MGMVCTCKHYRFCCNRAWLVFGILDRLSVGLVCIFYADTLYQHLKLRYKLLTAICFSFLLGAYIDCLLIKSLALKQVKTVEGVTELQIPSGTQPGDVLVLAKKGAPKLNRPTIRGDHLFTVKVSIPNRIRCTVIITILLNYSFN